MKFQQRMSYLFTGLAYIVVAVLTIVKPKFFYYWVAGIFLLQGVLSIVRGIFGTKREIED